jgi:hypothetical protein
MLDGMGRGAGMSLWTRKQFFTIKCDSIDGKGCGHVWLEGFGLYNLMCPVCGRLAVDGNIIVNDGDTPDVRLASPGTLVVFEEAAL